MTQSFIDNLNHIMMEPSLSGHLKNNKIQESMVSAYQTCLEGARYRDQSYLPEGRALETEFYKGAAFLIQLGFPAKSMSSALKDLVKLEAPQQPNSVREYIHSTLSSLQDYHQRQHQTLWHRLSGAALDCAVNFAENQLPVVKREKRIHRNLAVMQQDYEKALYGVSPVTLDL